MENKKIVYGIVAFCVILASGILFSNTDDPQTDKPIGGETDEHGCLNTAGYTWCEAKQKCLRTWEEPCETFNLETCNSECIEKEYDAGHCMRSDEIRDDDVEIGVCQATVDLKHCEKEGQCNCYCKHERAIGGDTDEHGCMLMAGYTWCEAKQKCLRIWEEDCPSEANIGDNVPLS